jgi:hypothetical protein
VSLARHLLYGLSVAFAGWLREREDDRRLRESDDVCRCGHERWRHDGPGGPEDCWGTGCGCMGFAKGET